MTCDKCQGPAVAATCCSLCTREHARCEACGGAAGARRSHRSHAGLYHTGQGAIARPIHLDRDLEAAPQPTGNRPEYG